MNFLASLFGGGSSPSPIGSGTSSGKGSSTAQSYTGFSTNNSSAGGGLNVTAIAVIGLFAVLIVGLIYLLRK